MTNLLDTGAYCGRTFEAAEPKPAAPRVGQTTVVERWDGTRWVEKKLVWNGQAFSEVISLEKSQNVEVTK